MTAALPGPSAGILGLLVDRHAGIPAPIDEDREQQRDDEVAEAHRERVDPRSDGLIEPAGGWLP